MKIHLQKSIILTFITFLTACATSPVTEAEKYHDVKSGAIYKAYQEVSINALKPVVEEYDKHLAKDNKAQVANTQVHSLLGLIWVASSQPKFALAEADYALAQADDPRDRYAALTIQALAMYGQGWPYLGKSKSVEAKALVKTHGLGNRYNNGIALVHVAGSALALQEGNILFVADEIRALGKATNQAWLTGLGDVTADTYNGVTSKAYAQLDKIKNDSNLSSSERQDVDRVMNVLKAGGKDVATSVAKETVSVAIDNVIEKSSLTSKILDKLPEKYRDKMPGNNKV